MLIYTVLFSFVTKKKKKQNTSDSVGCKRAKCQPVKVSTRFDLVFIFEQIGSNVIDQKKSDQPQIVYFFYN